jgi:transposase
MSRGDLTDEQWERLNPHLPPQKTGQPGGQWKDHRTVLNGILWITRTGAPWRDLPERYGAWQTCYDRFARWQQDGTWLGLLQILQAEADAQDNVEWEGCAVDSTSIKAHPHAAGAPRDKGGPTASRQKHHRRRRRLRRARTGKPSDAVGAD